MICMTYGMFQKLYGQNNCFMTKLYTVPNNDYQKFCEKIQAKYSSDVIPLHA